MKSKETLEEAIKYYAHNNFDMHETNNYKALEKGFEAGAEWQQERSYSELIKELELRKSKQMNIYFKKFYDETIELIEQFKKKNKIMKTFEG